MSVVINLFGGPGLGKTTLSAEIFYKMKVQKLNCELVQEWIKTWAYEGREIGDFDQFYITGKQIRKESFLYHKVDYIVTDSPIWLSAIYEQINSGKEYLAQHIAGFTEYAESKGIKYQNFLLTRLFEYEQIGRFHSEEEAIKVDQKIQSFLEQNNLSYEILDVVPESRADYIIQKVLAQDKINGKILEANS